MGSEVQRLRQQIEAEYIGARRALYEFTPTARHQMNNLRTQRLDGYHEKLSKLVGEQKATEIIIEINDRIAPPQARLEPQYCVMVNGNVAYFGLSQQLAEQTWIAHTAADPTKHVEVSVNGVVQAVREPVDEKPGTP